MATAERIVAKNKIAANARELADFDQSLLPVPVRAGQMNVLSKFGRKLGRALGPSSAKQRKSDKAKQLRKGTDRMSSEHIEQAYNDVKAMGGGSHRQRRAEFDIGLQHAILAMHGRAVAFENADLDIMKLRTAISDKSAVADHLAPYQAVATNGGYAKAVADFRQLATGYRNQLDRSKDAPSVRELDQAIKLLDDDQQAFEAGIEYIKRELAGWR